MPEIIETDSFFQNATNGEIFDGRFAIDRFDPVLGTLNAATIEVDVFFDSFGSLFADTSGIPFQSTSATANVLFELDPDEDVLGFTPFVSITDERDFIGLFPFGPTPVFLTGSGDTGALPVLDLQPFTGTGELQIDYSFFAGVSAFSPLIGAGGPFFVNDTSAILTVAYDYTPVPGVVRTGGPGNDRLDGTPGFDTLRGGAGDDTLVGRQGDDVLDGGPGADRLFGGEGRDVASYESATRSVRVDLENDRFMFGDAVGDTFVSIEAFQTGRFADQLRGDAGANDFSTGAFSDRLYGRGGDDILNGEGGADALYGNSGADVMTGGSGAQRDRFIYFQVSDTGVGAGNRDVITDFVSGRDRIEISRFDADATRGGNQAFTFIGNDPFSNRPGELRYGVEDGFIVVQGDLTGGGAPDFDIELRGTPSVDAGDFLL